MNKIEDKHSYKGWLNSDKFLKRAFGIMGHYIAAQAILAAVIGSIILLFLLIGTIGR